MGESHRLTNPIRALAEVLHPSDTRIEVIRTVG